MVQSFVVLLPVVVITIVGGHAADTEGAHRPLSKLVFWEPNPFRSDRNNDLTGTGANPGDVDSSLAEWERSVETAEEELETRLEKIRQGEARLDEGSRTLEEWRLNLEKRKRDFECSREKFRHSWAEQETSQLHLIIFRLVRIQATAQAVARNHPMAFGHVQSASAELLDRTTAEKQEREASAILDRAKWSAVEVLTCLRAGLTDVAGELPIVGMMRASTPLTLVDVCQGNQQSVLDRPMAILSRFLAHFDGVLSRDGLLDSRTKPVLYILLPGSVNAFFNQIADDPTVARYSSFSETAAAFIRRYEAVVGIFGDSEWHPIVTATEPLCRLGSGSQPCGEGSGEGPSWLHAAGLAGPLASLRVLFITMVNAGGEGLDLTSRLRIVADANPGALVPDVHETMFGSFAEVAPGACQGSAFAASDLQGSWCGRTPCCPVGADIRTMHLAFSSRFTVEGCAVRRKGSENTPLLWHGDGIARWVYALALTGLAENCPGVSRLLLASQPVDILDNLFARFEASQAPGAMQKKPENWSS